MERYKNFLVEELFTLTRGKSKYTRSYAEKNPGIYPVYSASLNAPLCYINTFDYDGDYLTWTTNGYGGRIQIISGKFSINGDRGIFTPSTEQAPDLNYIKRYLEPILIEQAVGRIVDGKKNEYTKVSPAVVENSVLTLPINQNGVIDFPSITATADKIKSLDLIQETLRKQQEHLDSIEVTIDIDAPYTTILLNDKKHFTLSIGNRVLKKDSLDHGVPVYSANVNSSFAFIARSNLKDFSRPSLLWGIDGIFSWNIISAGVEFATTDHCGRLQIISDLLDPEYVYNYLQATRLEYGFDRVFRSNLENIQNLVEIKVPVNADGSFSVGRQKEIANRYKRINSLKDKITEKLLTLSSVKIDVTA